MVKSFLKTHVVYKKGMPCKAKVGDTLYFVNEYRPTPTINKYCITSIVTLPYGTVRYYVDNSEKYFLVPDKNVVFSQEAAEARLKELRGGYGNVDNRS